MKFYNNTFYKKDIIIAEAKEASDDFNFSKCLLYDSQLKQEIINIIKEFSNKPTEYIDNTNHEKAIKSISLLIELLKPNQKNKLNKSKLGDEFTSVSDDNEKNTDFEKLSELKDKMNNFYSQHSFDYINSFLDIIIEAIKNDKLNSNVSYQGFLKALIEASPESVLSIPINLNELKSKYISIKNEQFYATYLEISNTLSEISNNKVKESKEYKYLKSIFLNGEEINSAVDEPNFYCLVETKTGIMNIISSIAKRINEKIKERPYIQNIVKSGSPTVFTIGKKDNNGKTLFTVKEQTDGNYIFESAYGNNTSLVEDFSDQNKDEFIRINEKYSEIANKIYSVIGNDASFLNELIGKNTLKNALDKYSLYVFGILLKEKSSKELLNFIKKYFNINISNNNIVDILTNLIEKQMKIENVEDVFTGETVSFDDGFGSLILNKNGTITVLYKINSDEELSILLNAKSLANKLFLNKKETINEVYKDSIKKIISKAIRDNKNIDNLKLSKYYEEPEHKETQKIQHKELKFFNIKNDNAKISINEKGFIRVIIQGRELPYINISSLKSKNLISVESYRNIIKYIETSDIDENIIKAVKESYVAVLKINKII